MFRGVKMIYTTGMKAVQTIFYIYKTITIFVISRLACSMRDARNHNHNHCSSDYKCDFFCTCSFRTPNNVPPFPRRCIFKLLLIRLNFCSARGEVNFWSGNMILLSENVHKYETWIVRLPFLSQIIYEDIYFHNLIKNMLNSEILQNAVLRDTLSTSNRIIPTYIHIWASVCEYLCRSVRCISF